MGSVDSQMYDVAVVIQVSPLHDEQEVYYCPTAEVEIELIEMPDGSEEKIRWVKFVPSNGRNQGQLTRVPYERLISISERM